LYAAGVTDQSALLVVADQLMLLAAPDNLPLFVVANEFALLIVTDQISLFAVANKFPLLIVANKLPRLPARAGPIVTADDQIDVGGTRIERRGGHLGNIAKLTARQGLPSRMG
jgi:hypothetical protein